MNKLTINFNKISTNTLFTGRKNGEKAQELFEIKEADYYEITSSNDQLITSSYFLGLLGEQLQHFGTPNEILAHINMDKLSKKSQEECIRAIKRGFAQRALV